MLSHLPKHADPRVLVGYETSDDAGVYLLNNDTALVQTLDFFSPMTDDPFLFGQIAAANALSDVYAMGGTPLTALNIACYANCLAPEVMGEVLRGGAQKALEAKVVILGGHTVENADVKYGLSVTGIVSPQKIITNRGARPGDRLILTKPLGNGIVATAVKAEIAEEGHAKTAFDSMAELNKAAAEAFLPFEVRGGTDVTGFGLLGHCVELARGSEVGINITADALPLLPGALSYAAMGLIPAGAYHNREHFAPYVYFAEHITDALRDVLFDPQTSGGLLFALEEQKAAAAILALDSKGVQAAVVGECVSVDPGCVKII